MARLRAADAAALAGAAQLDAFLERSATVAAASVGADGTIHAANDVLARFVGPQTSIYDAVAEGQHAVVAELLEHAGPVWRSVHAGLVAKDGNVVDCELSALARGDGILVVAELLHEQADLLNRHLLELNDELIAARRELAAGNRKLRELDELKNMFIATASHDLKTPMTSIVGFADALGEVELDDEARPMVATIQRNARRLVAMIDDLLGAAVIMTGELRLDRAWTDLAALVRDAVAAIEPAALAGGVTVELDAPETAFALLDGRRIMQILDNLLSNAVKYSPDGGRVAVTCRADGAEVSVGIADSGIGIPPDEQAQLFGRFFRASTARERGIVGTGLGLANARGFAEAHGGRLECASEVGVGSTFTFALPVGGEPQ